MTVVYNLYTYEKRFEGTIDECLKFIDGLPGGWSNPVDVVSKALYDQLYLQKAGSPLLLNHSN